MAVDEAESGEADTQPKDPTCDPDVKNLPLMGSLDPGVFTSVDTAVCDNTDGKEAVYQGNKERIRAREGCYEVNSLFVHQNKIST